MESSNTEATVNDRLVLWLVVSHTIAFLIGAVIHAWITRI